MTTAKPSPSTPRRSFLPTLPAAFAAAALAGCSFSVSTGPTDPAAAGGSPAATPDPAGAGGPSTDASDPRMAKLLTELRKTTYANITEDQLQIDKYHLHIFMARGETYAPPPPCEGNPLPTWLTKWDCPQVTHQPMAALVQARLNETYAADLPAAVAKERAAWKTFDADVTERLTKAKAIPGLYERAPALFALLRAARAEIEQKKLPRHGNEAPGALHDVAEAILKAYQDAGAAFAFDKALPTETGYLVHDADIGDLRPWSSDADEDRHFAALSIRGEAPDFLRGLPAVLTSPSASPVAWVKWPFDLAPGDEVPVPPGTGAVAKKIEEAARKDKVLAYPTGILEDAKNETLASVIGPSSSRLAWVSGRVLRVDAKDGAFTVELGHDVWKADTKCVAYGPITGVNPRTGQLTRNEKCTNTNERETKRRFRVTLADWPRGIDLGDVVAVFGDLQSVAAKGTKAHMNVAVTLAGRFVGCSTPMDPVNLKDDQALRGVTAPMRCKNPW